LNRAEKKKKRDREGADGRGGKRPATGVGPDVGRRKTDALHHPVQEKRREETPARQRRKGRGEITPPSSLRHLLPLWEKKDYMILRGGGEKGTFSAPLEGREVFVRVHRQ